MELIDKLTEASVPAILVIAGIAFLLLANVVSVKNIEVRQGGHRKLGMLGFSITAIGVAIYAVEYIPRGIFPSPSEIGKSGSYTDGIRGRLATATSFSQWGKGDFIFNVTPPHSDCPNGLWLSKSDPGFDGSMNIILEALTNDLEVIAYGEPKNLWSGTNGVRCHLYQITLTGSPPS